MLSRAEILLMNLSFRQGPNGPLVSWTGGFVGRGGGPWTGGP
jgi:hypothetical protein